MSNLLKIFTILWSFSLLACGKGRASQEMNVPPLSTQVKQNTSPLRIQLKELDKTSAKEQWRQFFQERGAEKLFTHKILSSNKNGLDLSLSDLDSPGFPDEVVAGIIQYLIQHNPGIQHLTIDGDDQHDSTKKLTELSSKIGQLSQLRTLYLMNHRLTQIPSDIERLTELQVLDLYDNQLVELPSTIKNLTKLVVFTLSKNCLKALPKEIGNLSNLKTFSVDHNLLTEIPFVLGNLWKLDEIYLDNNQLSILPANLRLHEMRLTVKVADNPWIDLSQKSTTKIEIATLKEYVKTGDWSKLQGKQIAFYRTFHPYEFAHIKTRTIPFFWNPLSSNEREMQAILKELGNTSTIYLIDLPSSQIIQ